MTKKQIECGKRRLKAEVTAFASKLAPIYAILGWHWHYKHETYYVPSAEDIERTLNRLIDGLQAPPDSPYVSSSTGGLVVYIGASESELEAYMRFEVDRDCSLSAYDVPYEERADLFIDESDGVTESA